MNLQKRRRLIVAIVLLLVIGGLTLSHPELQSQLATPAGQSKPLKTEQSAIAVGPAVATLESLAVKGRAPRTNYSRDQFGGGWETVLGCSTRNIILNRDLISPAVDSNCSVISGQLNDPYTGSFIEFKKGADTSSKVQIDHVVALGNAWQTGAQQLSSAKRTELANDPLELLAVYGPANQQKSDGDAATWLPSNKPFRCQYVARQVAIKAKYNLWVTATEKEAISRVLTNCPGQPLPVK